MAITKLGQRVWWVALLAVFVTGCPPASIPVMKDPLAEHSITRTARTDSLENIPKDRLALIISENTQNIIAWQTKTREHQRNSLGAQMFVTEENRRLADTELDSAKIVVRFSAILKSQFPEVSVVKDLSAAGRYPLAAILDIQNTGDASTEGLFSIRVTETWKAALYFVKTDGSRSLVREIVTAKTGSVTGSGNEMVRKSWVQSATLRTQAIDDLESQLIAALR